MGKYLTRVETDFLLKSVNQSKLNLVMDIGAEAGRFSMVGTTQQVTAIGIDIDLNSLKRLKQKNRNVIVIQADARKIPLREHLFDAVFMIEVLDYIPEADEALSECNRILKSASPLVLSFGNQSSLKAKLRGFRGKSYLHSYSEIVQSLCKTRFKVTKKMGYSWLPLGRMSNSKFVPFLSATERVLGLRHIPRWSPWVMLCAVKSSP